MNPRSVESADGRSARRELRLAVLLSVAGAAAVLLATSRDWLRVQLPQATPLPPVVEHLTGAALLPGARPLALVGLAGVAALFAARRAGRVVVGLIVLLCGAGVMVLTLRLLGDRTGAVARVERQRSLGVPLGGQAHLGAWPWLCLAGGLLVAVAGLLVMARGRRWATLSSAYDAPAGARADAAREAGGARADASAGAGVGVPADASAGVPADASRAAGGSGVVPSASSSSPGLGALATDKGVWDALDRGEDPTG